MLPASGSATARRKRSPVGRVHRDVLRQLPFPARAVLEQAVLVVEQFLAMILVVVYVGAVAVLFLFIVMLLDVDFARMKQGFVDYLPQGLLIAFCVGAMLVYVVSGWAVSPNAAVPATPSGTISNTAALGEVLYTRYFYFFQAAGMILLTAMIGAIVLTLQHKVGVKRQNIAAQVARNPETAVELRKVPSRVGI